MQDDTMLGGYRVLDLTEGGYLLGGQLFGDLGADVIKIEPPAGSPSRNIGTYYKDIPDGEKNLFWFAYNRNKRGITLNIETEDGKQLFKKLAASADVVLESFDPGYMDGLGLGYVDLCRIKPDIIYTAITPYGQEGPKSGYKTSDLTTWAASMIHSITGDADRAPTWNSYPSAGLMGGIQGVIGSLYALFHREVTGEGQKVDVPVQQYLLQFTTGAHWFYECMKLSLPRMGRYMTAGFLKVASIRPCKDGYVHWALAGGAAAGFSDSTARMVKWMDEEGMAPDWLKEIDWLEFGAKTVEMTQEELDRIQEPFDKFLMTRTTIEFSEETAKRGIMGCPVSDSKDIYEDHHLEARDFWQQVDHPELGETLTYCGPFAKFSQAPMKTTRRASLIGEHNKDIYEKELGMSREDIILFKQAGII